MEELGKITSKLMTIVIVTALNAFVFMKLWITVPVFAVTPLTFPQSYGVAVFLMFIVHKRDKKGEEDLNENTGKKLLKSIGDSILFSLFFLLLGYIASLFI